METTCDRRRARPDRRHQPGRTLTLNRPDALNAFSEALYDATTIALKEAAADPDVSVVLLTGAGRAFSAGNDLVEMQEMVTNPEYQMGSTDFPA